MSNTTEPTITTIKKIHENHGITISKDVSENNKYIMSLSIENNYINLTDLINFNLAQIIYEVNKDIFENINIIRISENEAVVCILIKHFFEDIFSQQYICLNMKLFHDATSIMFSAKTNSEFQMPFNIPKNAELLDIDTILINCAIKNTHKVEFKSTIKYMSSLDIPEYIEKLAAKIINKIFMRTKQFIELYSYNT